MSAPVQGQGGISMGMMTSLVYFSPALSSQQAGVPRSKGEGCSADRACGCVFFVLEILARLR